MLLRTCRWLAMVADPESQFSVDPQKTHFCWRNNWLSICLRSTHLWFLLEDLAGWRNDICDTSNKSSLAACPTISVLCIKRGQGEHKRQASKTEKAATRGTIEPVPSTHPARGLFLKYLCSAVPLFYIILRSCDLSRSGPDYLQVFKAPHNEAAVYVSILISNFQPVIKDYSNLTLPMSHCSQGLFLLWRPMACVMECLCPPPNSYVESLTPSVAVFEDGGL